MRISVGKKDTIWSFLGTALSMGANLIILPFILRYLNDDEVAIYYVFTSLSAIAILFDFGFSPSIARSMAYAWSGVSTLKSSGTGETDSSEPNYVLMQTIIKTCKIIYFVISSIALILLLSIGTFYISYITRENPQSDFIISWLIYAVAIFLNILFSYYSVFLRGVGAVAKINIATIVSRLLQIFICVITLILGFGLVGVAVAYLVYGFLFRILGNVWFYRYCNIGKHLNRKQRVSKEEVKSVIKVMWPNTWRDGLVTLSNYLLNQATTVIASLYLTLQETGVFSLSVQLTSAIATIAGTLYTTYQPALQSAFANKEKYKQKEYMSIVLLSFVVLYGLGMVALITVGLPLIQILRPGYTISISILLLVGLYQFILKLRNCYCSYISTTNRLIYSNSFLISAIVCVSLAILFSKTFGYGIYGLVIAQLLSQFIYNAWHWPIFVHKELELGIIETLKLGSIGIKNLIRRRNNK